MKTDLFGANSRGGYRSLDFEPGLMAQIGRAPRPTFRRRTPRGHYWAAAALAAALICGAVAWMRTSDDDRAVAQMAATAFQWVRDGQVDPAHLDADDSGFSLRSLWGDSTVSAEPNAEPGDERAALRQALLNKIRADIQTRGGKWEQAKPLAFGGVRARVNDPEAGSATAVTGNVYFDAGGHVYALELSAERLGDRYIPTDIWQCTPLDCAPDQSDALEAHSQKCYEDFLGETAPAAEPAPEILDPEPLFIPL